MDEIQAAFLSVKIKYLLSENARRREIADYYCKNITNPKIILPQQPFEEMEHVHHLFVVRTANRDALQQYLTENGVQTLIHYPIPPHKQQCYKEWNDRCYPITQQIHNEVLSIPISPVMTDQEVMKVVEVINRF